MKRKLTVICIAALLLSACGGKGQNEKAVESGEAVVAGEKIEQGLEAKESESVFRESLQEENSVNLDDYVGFYTNGSYDEVRIEKEGNGYSMEVGLYRLTTIDEGTVSASAEGVVFDALDAGGNPIRLTFYKNEAGSYTLRVDETTWTYLQNGDTVENMVKTTNAED